MSFYSNEALRPGGMTRRENAPPIPMTVWGYFRLPTVHRRSVYTARAGPAADGMFHVPFKLLLHEPFTVGLDDLIRLNGL